MALSNEAKIIGLGKELDGKISDLRDRVGDRALYIPSGTRPAEVIGVSLNPIMGDAYQMGYFTGYNRYTGQPVVDLRESFNRYVHPSTRNIRMEYWRLPVEKLPEEVTDNVAIHFRRDRIVEIERVSAIVTFSHSWKPNFHKSYEYWLADTTNYPSGVLDESDGVLVEERMKVLIENADRVLRNPMRVTRDMMEVK